MELYFGKPVIDKIVLDEDESIHLLKVRRAIPGVQAYVTDGEGNLYETILLTTEKKRAVLEIKNVQHFERPAFSLHIAVAPTKNIDRIEWFLEKAIETGISEVSFPLCQHSERRNINIERMHRVALSAMKQSRKYYFPKINPPVSFNLFLENIFSSKKFICTMNADKNSSLKNNYSKGESLTVLIGPEGDFTKEEIGNAVKNGFNAITLGESRLRTETAALNVCTVFNFLNS